MEKERFDELMSTINDVTDTMLEELSSTLKNEKEEIRDLFINGFKNYANVVPKYSRDILRLTSSREMYYTFTKKPSSLTYVFSENVVIHYNGKPLTLKEEFDNLFSDEKHTLSINFDDANYVIFSVGKCKQKYRIPITERISEFQRLSTVGDHRYHDLTVERITSKICDNRYLIQFMKILASQDLETLIQMAILGIKKYYLEEIEKAKAKATRNI